MGWFRAGLAAVLLLIGAASPAIGSRSVDVEESTSVSLGPSLAELLEGSDFLVERKLEPSIQLHLTAPRDWLYSDLQIETRLKGQKLDRYLERLDQCPLSVTASRSYRFFARLSASGVCVGPNQYQFALNSPYNFSDPTGELAFVNNLFGGGVSVAMGFLATCLFEGCDQYSLADAGVDFSLGFATSGLSSLSKLKHLSKGSRYALRGGLEAGLDVGAEMVRYELKGEDYTFGDLAFGAALNFGIGESGRFGSWLASGSSRYLDSGSRAFSNFLTDHGGIGASQRGLLSMSRGYTALKSSRAGYALWRAALQGRQALRSTRSVMKTIDDRFFGQIDEHHIFPRQLRPRFKAIGIDVDDYVLPVRQRHHLRGIHGRGLTSLLPWKRYPGGYNSHWVDFLDDLDQQNLSNAAKRASVFENFKSIRSAYGLRGTPRRYGR